MLSGVLIAAFKCTALLYDIVSCKSQRDSETALCVYCRNSLSYISYSITLVREESLNTTISRTTHVSLLMGIRATEYVYLSSDFVRS